MARLWFIGLAVVCGLALLAPGLLNPPSARAATVLVDDFSTDQAKLEVWPDLDRDLATDVSSSVSGAGILGGERDIRVRTNVGHIDNPNNTMWAVVANGIFESHNQYQVSGSNEIQWDGPDGDGDSLDPTGLGGVDLTDGGTEGTFHIRVVHHNLGAPTGVITVYTDASNYSTYPVNLVSSNDPRDYFVEFSSFAAVAGSGADFTDVGAIQFFVNIPFPYNSAPHLDFIQTIRSDEAPPMTTASLSGTAGNPGWYTSDVQVTLNATDNQFGVDDTFYRLNDGQWTIYSSPFTVSDQGDTTVTFYSNDTDGNTETNKSVSFRIDTVDPVTTASLSRPPDHNGWYTGPVQVTLNRSDATSGISYTSYNAIGGSGVLYTGPFTLSEDGEYNVRFFSADQAGNFETFKSVIVKIDQTAPSITGSATPPANVNGWNNTDVTVSFTCSDGTEGSGVDSLTPDTTLTDEGTNQSVEGSCTDLAGHSASDTVDGINIDKTAPVVTLVSVETADGNPYSPGAGSWTNQDVTVTFTCAAAGPVQSGIDQNTVGSVTLTTEGEDQTATSTGACTDQAGNSATAANEGGINIDKTAPVINGLIETADGNPFTPGPDVWTNQDVTVTVHCADTGTVQSGLAESLDGIGTIDDEGQGHSITFSGCVDQAGNRAAPFLLTDINIDKTAPTAVTGGPYVVDEGGSISLDGSGSTDALSGVNSLAWALDDDNQFDDADPASFVGVDGPASIPVALQVTDYAGNVTTVNTTVTVNNAAPDIISVTNDGPPSTGSTVSISVDATDPAGVLDPLSYEFDCDNDLDYEIDPQPENTASCDIGIQEGSLTVNVRVTDDDGREALGSTVISVPTEMCANRYTGLLRYADGCRDYEQTVVLSINSPVSICVNDHTGVLRYLQHGGCSPSETWLSLPDDGPLAVCVSGYTQVMRAVDGIQQCQPFESGRIIGNNSDSSPNDGPGNVRTR